MSNENSLGWLWVWLRRVAVHAVLGLFAGALFGALSVCLAGVLIALLVAVAARPPGITSPSFDEVAGFCLFAGTIGLAFGGITGGVSGLFSWLITATTTSSGHWRALFKRTGWTLFGGAMSGVCGYVTWCLWHSLNGGKPFIREFSDRAMEAAFGVSAWMAVAHLAAMLVLAGRVSTPKRDDSFAAREFPS